MKPEIEKLLLKVAKLNNMKKINAKYYRGEHGTIFKITNFGFILPDHTKDLDIPKNF